VDVDRRNRGCYVGTLAWMNTWEEGVSHSHWSFSLSLPLPFFLPSSSSFFWIILQKKQSWRWPCTRGHLLKVYNSVVFKHIQSCAFLTIL
jgi:hypothetical protein